MPIYEFGCPKCRRIFNFLSKRVNPDRQPVCPKCGNKKMQKQLSRFAMSRNLKEAAGPDDGPEGPDFDDPRIARAMSEMEGRRRLGILPNADCQLPNVDFVQSAIGNRKSAIRKWHDTLNEAIP